MGVIREWSITVNNRPPICREMGLYLSLSIELLKSFQNEESQKVIMENLPYEI